MLTDTYEAGETRIKVVTLILTLTLNPNPGLDPYVALRRLILSLPYSNPFPATYP